MTTAQLKRCCRTWQKRLRICDWNVDIAFKAADEMDNCLGRTYYDPRGLSAVVEIADNLCDEMYPDGGIEATVIHELLHVTLHGDKEFKKEDVMLERAINQIADALYYAYKRRK